jgi:hypothetical protein
VAGAVVTSGRQIASWRVGLPLLRNCVAGSDGDGSDDGRKNDDELFEDDELADLLAAQALGDDDEDGDLLGLDDPTEDELLEQLQTNDPLLANPAVAALRQLWRESEGPFASGDLDEAMSHLRQRVTSPEEAIRAINKSVGALKQVVEEYPDWPEPLNELATCELLRANPDESVRMSLRVLGKQPAHFDCLARLALSYAIIGNSEEGAATIDKLENVCPVLARPLRELVKALSAAVKKAEAAAKSSGSGQEEGSSDPEMIRLEIDPATLESLGPILQGMGGFGDAMQGLGAAPGEEFADLMQGVGDEDGADLLPSDYDDLDDGDILLDEERGSENVGRTPEQLIPDGAEVVLAGLSNSEHNGMTGTNRGFDSSRGRYVVELADGRQIAVKPANVDETQAEFDNDNADDETEVLQVDVGDRVELVGLVKAAAQNGKTGVLRNVDEDTGRFVVELEGDGKMLAVKPQNLKRA